MINFMAVRGARAWRALGLALLLGVPVTMSGRVRADANGGIAAAIGLTAADGSVRTQAGVRLSISPAPGAPDRVFAMSAPVQARMSILRGCFAAAMLRSPAVEGRAEFELEAAARGAAKVRVALDETRDPELISCMKGALSRTALKDVARGSRALVGLYLSNPLAAFQRKLREEPPATAVTMLAGGRAESQGGTQAGEVRFRVIGSAYAARTISHLQRDIAAHLAGLLDCRRKSFRHAREASGEIAIELSLRDGALEHGKPRSSLRRSAGKCVAHWLDRLDTSRLGDADLELAISFSP